MSFAVVSKLGGGKKTTKNVEMLSNVKEEKVGVYDSVVRQRT